MNKKMNHLLKEFIIIFTAIAFAMTLLFPVLLYLFPIVIVLRIFELLSESGIHRGYLTQIRTVCKIE